MYVHCQMLMNVAREMEAAVMDVLTLMVALNAYVQKDIVFNRTAAHVQVSCARCLFRFQS